MKFSDLRTIRLNTTPKTETDILNDILFIDIIICLYIELIKCYSGIAAYLNLIPDLCNILAILILFKSGRVKFAKRFSTISALLFMAWVTMSFSESLFNFFVGYKRYRYILFGFLAFYICTHYMTEFYWNRVLKALFYTQYIHTFLVIIQFAVIRTVPDMTNGVFGYLGHNNSAQGIFCLVMSMIGTEYFLKKAMPIKYCISMIIMSCLTCALAEIKAFFVLFFLGVAIILLLNKRDNRTLKRGGKLILIGIVGIVMAFLILLKIMPQNLYAFIGFKNWASYESYGNILSGINMGRLNQVSYIFANIFENSFLKALVGKGIGVNGEFAVYEMGKLFFNFGFIGLGIFLVFLFGSVLDLLPYRKKVPEAMISISTFFLTVPVMMMWNATLNRMALLFFVILGIGFAKCFHINEKI